MQILNIGFQRMKCLKILLDLCQNQICLWHFGRNFKHLQDQFHNGTNEKYSWVMTAINFCHLSETSQEKKCLFTFHLVIVMLNLCKLIKFSGLELLLKDILWKRKNEITKHKTYWFRHLLKLSDQTWKSLVFYHVPLSLKSQPSFFF